VTAQAGERPTAQAAGSHQHDRAIAGDAIECGAFLDPDDGRIA
jgi:hypothetical protein